MSKSASTKIQLEEALDRLISGRTKRVAPSRKLSIRSVEDEAGLGDGSAYYYPEIIQNIKKAIQKQKFKENPEEKNKSELARIRDKLSKERRLKDKYRKEVADLKAKLSQLASIHNQMAITEQEYIKRINNLEMEVLYLKQQSR